MSGWVIPEVCDVCGRPLLPGTEILFHHRLAATWHAGHPLTDIKGEDVTLHTLGWGVVSEAGEGHNPPS